MLSELDMMNLWAKQLTGYASQWERLFGFGYAVEAEVRKQDDELIQQMLEALETRYGLTPSDVQAMLEKQGGACAICVLPLTKHHIDHCHTTGKVRGLLCHRCNTRLGGLDDKQWRDAALRYLGLQA